MLARELVRGLAERARFELARACALTVFKTHGGPLTGLLSGNPCAFRGGDDAGVLARKWYASGGNDDTNGMDQVIADARPPASRPELPRWCRCDNDQPKKWFPTRAEAKAYARQWLGHRHFVQYRCPACEGWHNATRRRSSQ